MEVPGNILNYRKEMCKSCPTPCEHRLDVTYLKEGNNVCPKSRFKAYQLFVKNAKPQFKGAGDVVASVAEPIAGIIDRISGGRTKLKGCSACRKRKEMLNQLLPFGS